MLLSKVQELEKTLANLPTHATQDRGSDELLMKVIGQYKSNVWKLKEYILALPSGDERLLYEKAYYEILANKGSWIGVTSKFLSIPILPHGLFGIFISGGSVIGKNVVIFQQVTIGSNTLFDSKKKVLL